MNTNNLYQKFLSYTSTIKPRDIFLCYLSSIALGIGIALAGLSWIVFLLLLVLMACLLFYSRFCQPQNLILILLFLCMGFVTMSLRLQDLSTQVPNQYFFPKLKGQVDKIKHYKTGSFWAILHHMESSPAQNESLLWKSLGQDLSLQIFVRSSSKQTKPMLIKPGDWITITNVKRRAGSRYKSTRTSLNTYNILPSIHATINARQIISVEPATPAHLDFWYQTLAAQTSAMSPVGQALVDAILTGRRDGQGFRDMIEILRPAGLSHVIAISGLHMSLLANFVFWLVMLLASFVPAIYLHFSMRKIAAGASILVCFIYLVMTNFPVVAQRAFIMIVMFLLAIMIDRRSSSIRSLSMAGIVLLLIWPEYLLHIGLQFSFICVLILICVYEDYQRKHIYANSDLDAGSNWFEKSKLVLLANLLLVIASNIIQIYHFSVAYPYALLGNIFLLPLFTLLVMPLIFISVPFVMLGLGLPVLWLVDKLTQALLFLAKLIQQLPWHSIAVYWSVEIWLLVIVGVYCCFLFERTTYKPAIFTGSLVSLLLLL